MIEMDPIRWLGFVIIIQTAIMLLYLRDIDGTLQKILKKLEAEA